MSARARRWLAVAALLATGCGSLGRPRETRATFMMADASDPTVACDLARGNTVAVWAARDGEQAVAWCARVVAKPRAAVRVSPAGEDVGPRKEGPPQVALGPDGEVYVLWAAKRTLEQRAWPASDLRLATSRDGGKTFEPPVHVNDDAGGVPSSHEFHDLAVGNDGTLFVSWLDERKLDAAGAVSAHMHEHMGEHMGEQVAELRFARSSDRGRSFAPSVVVDADGCICCRTAVTCLGADTVFVMFRKVYAGAHGAEHDMAVARSFDGGKSFQPAVRVHQDGWVLNGCPDIGPDIAAGSGGRLVVAWYTGAPGREGLYASASNDAGATFSAPMAVHTGEEVPTSEIKLAAAGGRVWAVWEATGHGAHDIWLAPISASGVSPKVEALGRGKSPAIASGGGSLAVAWEDAGAIRLVKRRL